MVSIVVCSTKQKVSDFFYQNIKNTVGVEFELITIDNSRNTYSIFEAYNLGHKKSKFEYICFVHEDVLFHTLNWGEKVIQHLKNKVTGFIGVAGGPIMPIVPASWIGTYSVFNLFQSDKLGRKKTKKRVKPIKYDKTTHSVVVLDGVFLCVRKEIFNSITFDENFIGFHCYDLDICIQSAVNGFTNYVVFDILIEHFSRGKRDKSYFENLLFLYKKWENTFPVISDERKKFYMLNAKKIEIRKLKDLVKSLLLNDFDCYVVKDIYKYYRTKLKLKNFSYALLLLNLYVLFQCYVKVINRRRF